MRVLLLLLIASPTFTNVEAFSPSHRQHQQNNKLRLFRSTPKNGRKFNSQLSMVSIPNPLKKLPWNVQKEKEREERRLKQEGAKLYRELGIAEDCTFEELKETTDKLLLKYDGDIKKKIKVEISKDKILQIRLNQRMGGMVAETNDARANAYLNDEADEFKGRPERRQLPKWLRGIIVKPSRAWRDKIIIYFGAVAFLGLLSPKIAENLKLLTLFFACAFMSGRGTTDEGGGGDSLYRVGKAGIYTIVAIGISVIAFAIIGSVSTGIARSIPGMEASNFFEQFDNILTCIGMGLVTAYFQPYNKDRV